MDDSTQADNADMLLGALSNSLQCAIGSSWCSQLTRIHIWRDTVDFVIAQY
ncbi:MAG: hypothetical protein MHM6MM_001565 [Cercozoa sp. M6MM]